MDFGPVVQAVLFALFGALTAALTAVTGPTYDNLFAPEMAPSNAYALWQGGNVLARGVAFSNTILVEVVDPAAVLVIAAIGFLYLLRATLPSPRLAQLAPRLALGVLVSNLVIPILEGLWQFAGALYPVFYGYGGGAWRSYANLVGPGGVALSWDNGLLGFVVALLLFTMVLLLAVLVAFRSALLAVLLVLLPPLTLLWALPAAGPLARKAWALFVDMTFLPCLLIVPLALAVGASNVLLTLGLFTVALAMPQLLSAAGTSATHLGMPSPGLVVPSGIARGTATAQGTLTAWGRHGGRSFGRGFSAARGEGPGSGPGIFPGRSGARGRPSGGGAPVPVGEALGGPAALVAWGVQSSLGRLSAELGGRVGRAFPARGGGRRAPPGSLKEVTRAPRPRRSDPEDRAAGRGDPTGPWPLRERREVGGW